MANDNTPDGISAEMRARLLTNRQGKLTTEQWKAMVADPLVTLLVLLVPLAPVLILIAPRLLLLAARGLGFIGILVLLFIVLPLVLRARRYARVALHFAILYPAADYHPLRFWQLWKSQLFYTESGAEIRFRKRLAPHIRLKFGQGYLVYYLRDPGSMVLLSIAPEDHPDAEKWYPAETFKTRWARRA